MRIKISLLFLLTGIVTFSLFISCQKSDTSLDDSSIEIDQLKLEKDITQDVNIPFREFAKKNPYEIKNMRQAYEELNLGAKSNQPLDVSHLYVRFWVETPAQMDELQKQDITLENYPLDVEVTKDAEALINDIKHSEIGSWQYSAVPSSYSFDNSIQYQILEELYLPGTDSKANSKNSFDEQLERKALELVGESTKSSIAKKKRTPSGYIRVQDTETGLQRGVEGVTVRVRKWFKYSYGVTNSIGYYKVGKRFSDNPNYSVFFRNSRGFEVWSAVVNVEEAKYELGNQSNHGASVVFYPSSKGWRFATVNNASVAYYKEATRDGVRLPPNDLRIIASSASSGAGGAPLFRQVNGIYGLATNGFVKFLNNLNPLFIFTSAVLNKFGPDIILPSDGSRGTARVAYVCYHELAHASHYSLAGKRYWVDYINYIITYGAYGDGTGFNAGVAGIGEQWGNFYGDRVSRNVNNVAFLNADEDWYNPGFLRDVLVQTNDVTVSEIYNTLSQTNRSFNTMISRLKSVTNQDNEVDIAYNNYTDWP